MTTSLKRKAITMTPKKPMACSAYAPGVSQEPTFNRTNARNHRLCLGQLLSKATFPRCPSILRFSCFTLSLWWDYTVELIVKQWLVDRWIPHLLGLFFDLVDHVCHHNNVIIPRLWIIAYFHTNYDRRINKEMWRNILGRLASSLIFWSTGCGFRGCRPQGSPVMPC
jgi:hypothetical protein